MEIPHSIIDELSNRAKLNAITTHASVSIYTRLQTELDCSKVRSHNRRLAEHLKVLFAINDGRDIVLFIGSGKEKNNLEALIAWVASQQMGIESMEFTQQLETLGNKLQRDIDSALERFKRY